MLLKRPVWLSSPHPHLPASGDQPGTPEATSPPKLMRARALVPVLRPSTSFMVCPCDSNDSSYTVLAALPVVSSVLLSLSVPSTVESYPKCRLLNNSSSLSSAGTNWRSVVIGAKGLPFLLMGMGAGCMFSSSPSVGRHHELRNLPPWPMRYSGL